MHIPSSPSSGKDHSGTVVVLVNTLLFMTSTYFHFYFPPFSVLFLPQRSLLAI